MLNQPGGILRCDFVLRWGVFFVSAKRTSFRGGHARGSGDQGGMIAALRFAARKLGSIGSLPCIDSGPVAPARYRNAESPAAFCESDVRDPEILGQFAQRLRPSELVQVFPREGEWNAVF